MFDDPVEALAALAPPPRSDRRWPAVGAIGAALAAAALLAGVRAGGVGGPQAAIAVGLGVLGAVAALGYAARRPAEEPGDDVAGGDGASADPEDTEPGAGPREDPRLAALVAAGCAVPLAAAAGWAVLPGPPAATHLLLAAVAGGTVAALGQLAVRAVAPALIATVVVAVLTGSAAIVGLQFDVDGAALSAVTAAVALSTGPLLPRAVLRLAGLPRPVVPTDARDLVAADTGPDLLPAAELAGRARAARGQLAGLSGGCAVVAAAAAPHAAVSGGWAGASLAAVVVAVLLLRARGFADPGPAHVHLVAGSVAGAALIGLGATAAGPVGRTAGALVLLGGAALAVQGLGGPPPAVSPVARRAVDLAEGVLTAAAVPLALVAAGVFAAVRGL